MTISKMYGTAVDYFLFFLILIVVNLEEFFS